MTEFQMIRKAIEQNLQSGEERLFAIYPFGEFGIKTKQILNECFGIKEYLILDNGFCKTNKNVKPLEYLSEIDMSGITVLFTAGNPDIQDIVKQNLLKYCNENQIVEIFPISMSHLPKTKYGKYSYGPLCNHVLVEEVGAFCSFAAGTDVLRNHPTQYISTHPFLYYGTTANNIYKKYEDYKDRPWYFDEVSPKGTDEKTRRIIIGHDVWLGHNVLITNGANIGNGVIAAAGAVITKDVPDYAVVAGVPARIIRYRYTAEQIEMLNKVAWWEWSDDKIRECYDDFYLDIEEFLKKHYKE